MIEPSILPTVELRDLRSDSLGHYMATLGLLRTVSREWPTVRLAWLRGYATLVGGPSDISQVVDCITSVAERDVWMDYSRGWKDKREEARKAFGKKNRARGDADALTLWLADASEAQALLALAHSVPGTRAVHDNPLLGQSGVSTRRDFAKGWADARAEVSEQLAKDRFPICRDLQAFLTGEPCEILGGWNAGSWFSQANKLYNFTSNSTKTAAQDGQITPWAMLLACEGLSFFAGSASRRLGARSQSRGSFPFVCASASPLSADLVGFDKAEVWLPLWSRPMTYAEVTTLFARGRAETQSRGAVTPAAFAAAVVARGTDAGVDAFVRFSLGQTTSNKTFESRYAGAIRTSSVSQAAPTESQTMARLLRLLESLPSEKPYAKSKRPFHGLRGPLEKALVDRARNPDDPVFARELLDTVRDVCDRVDRSRALRRHEGIVLPLLPAGWVCNLFAESEQPSVEARLAMSLASVGSSHDCAGPFVAYRFGVEYGRRKPGGQLDLRYPVAAPARCVWASSALAENLAGVAMRRLIEAGRSGGSAWRDAESIRTKRLPFDASVNASLADVTAWLSGRVDERVLVMWLDRFVLFDWSASPPEHLRLGMPCSDDAQPLDREGYLALYALFRALCDPRGGALEGLLPEETGARSVGAARQICTLVLAGRLDEAVSLALSRYRMAGRTPWSLAMRIETLGPTAAQRLVASLLMQSRPRQLVSTVHTWIRPRELGKGT